MPPVSNDFIVNKEYLLETNSGAFGGGPFGGGPFGQGSTLSSNILNHENSGRIFNDITYVTESLTGITNNVLLRYENLLLFIDKHTDLLFRLLPELYKRQDVTGEVEKLLIDVLGSGVDDATRSIDEFTNIINFSTSPTAILDHILDMLGNPFNVEGFSIIDKRKTLSLLVTLYKQKGSVPSIINAVRIVLSIDISISETLGSELFWLLGTSRLAQ